MAASDDLRKAALRFRNADPQSFRDFIAAMEMWTGELLLAVTEASADRIFIDVGQARAAKAMLRILNECHLDRPKKPGAP